MLLIQTLHVIISPQTNSTQDSLIKPDTEGQQCVRVVAQRGKSMEELGATKLTKLSALSKSSEQLDQLWRYSAGPCGPDRDIRNVSFFAEVRKAQGQDGDWKKEYIKEQAAKEPAIVGQKNTQEQTRNQTQKKSMFKQNSESGEDGSVRTRNSSRSTSPAPSFPSRARVHSGPATDASMSGRPPSETSSNTPSPRGLEASEWEIKSTLSTPTQTKLPLENRCSSG